jgi:hypothetical protein
MKKTAQVYDLDLLKAAREINELHRMTVDKAARIGELLTQVKASLPHGQWLPWLKANVEFGHTQASMYMRAFETQKLTPGVSLPPTIKAAAAAAPSQRAKSKSTPTRMGWSQAAEHVLGELPEGFSRNTIVQQPEKRAAIEAELGHPLPGRNERIEADGAEAQAIADAVARCAARENPTGIIEATLSELPARERMTVEKALERTQHALKQSFDQAVDEEVRRRLETERAYFMKSAERHHAEELKLQMVRSKLSAFMTLEEFRLVRGCLHPDQPERSPERLRAAFQIFERVGNACDPTRPAKWSNLFKL